MIFALPSYISMRLQLIVKQNCDTSARKNNLDIPVDMKDFTQRSMPKIPGYVSKFCLVDD